MTGLVTAKDGASIEAINKIIDEYNAQTKREAKAFEKLKSLLINISAYF